MATDWHELPDGKEKYGLYLCSREWGLLRAAVHERAGGMCERCGINEIQAVHHLTYVRKYEERLEDLQAICRECHEAVHGKTTKNWQDPADLRYLVDRIRDWCASQSSDCKSYLGSLRWEYASNWVEAAAIQHLEGEDHLGCNLEALSAKFCRDEIESYGSDN